MFSWDDLDTFAIAFFVLLPIVAFIHVVGHKFFIWIFGEQGDLIIGRGVKLFQLGSIHFHVLYFIDSACNLQGMEKEKTWKQIVIYAGGILFNLIAIVVVNFLIIQGILPKSHIFYQFVYFSVYYIFFAIIPCDYGENNPSDGKSIYLAWKNHYKNR
ncbi:hypothetical protein [Bacillus sp. B1-b2]|uniref:hypothetical protein n=1 Tax=Bacillus sp. B1-b2 TaxID=2653201 RepID=UPI0012614935|nr:hypothetical protein [Bacillus sp. B1-b2]KAB7670737.1 hypothetical protein F9279_07930 [Bacillus sp. B1-b2]